MKNQDVKEQDEEQSDHCHWGNTAFGDACGVAVMVVSIGVAGYLAFHGCAVFEKATHKDNEKVEANTP